MILAFDWTQLAQQTVIGLSSGGSGRCWPSRSS
jgi:hypothetical protein